MQSFLTRFRQTGMWLLRPPFLPSRRGYATVANGGARCSFLGALQFGQRSSAGTRKGGKRKGFLSVESSWARELQNGGGLDAETSQRNTTGWGIGGPSIPCPALHPVPCPPRLSVTYCMSHSQLGPARFPKSARSSLGDD
jgi:hypothetical protein